MNKHPDPSKYYVFYDGDCGFCNYWIQWILKNDRRDQFLFSPLQSGFGQHFLRDRNLPQQQLNTLYLWKPNSFYYVKSEAVLEIAKLLGGKYQLMTAFKLFPKFFSDWVYDRIAKNRSKLPGAQCPVPTAQQKEKFIE